MMKLRKLTSLALLSTLAASMVVPAFAVDPTDPAFGTAEEATGEGTTGTVGTEVSSEVNVPVLKVEVPTAGVVVLNPYGMKYTVSSTDYTSQIINKIGLLTNKTDGISVDVTCVPTAVLPNGVELVATEAEVSTDADATDKQIFLELQVEDAATAPTALSSPAKIPMGATEGDVDEAKVTAAKKTLAANDDTATGAKKILAFQIAGKMSKVQGWTADDMAEINLAWTFAVHIT